MYFIKQLETAALILYRTQNFIRFRNNDFEGFALNLYVLKDNLGVFF